MCLSSPALPPAASAPAPLLAAAQAPGSTLPASADPALPHFAGAAAMNANSGELRRETESAQCCHAAGCCTCVCQLGRSGTQGPRYVMLTALHQLLMRMKYSGSLAHIRICSKYSHGHDVLENVVGGAMSSSEPLSLCLLSRKRGSRSFTFWILRKLKEIKVLDFSSKSIGN